MLNIGEVIRTLHYDTMPRGRYRAWLVVGHHSGGVEQESTYELRSIDGLENKPIQVPCILLERDHNLEIYSIDKWMSLPIVVERRRNTTPAS